MAMIAGAIVQVLVENVNGLIKDQIVLSMGVNGEMNKLFSSLTAIQATLQDAELKQNKSKALQDWLRKLHDLTYEIEDVLDRCQIQCAQHVKSRFSYFDMMPNYFRNHKIGRKIKKITERLDVIAEKGKTFDLSRTGVETPTEIVASRETGSTLNLQSRPVYGRERDSEIIVDIVLNHSAQEMSVLPIVGVGGLGKTTLAQLVFNDPRVVAHFELRVWVCVSDNFDLKTLFKAMIESASGSPSKLTRLDGLQRQLLGLLSNKKFLIVLDDVWNEQPEKWSDVRTVLACGSPGSSLIVTTRVQLVADIMTTRAPYELTGLDDELCWRLLQECAFGRNEEDEFPNLEPIGKQIAKKCAGVPLAAKALGGVLRFKRRTEAAWNYVLHSELWKLTPSEDLILPSLRLSYHHLPLHLRRCYAYCAVFPKGRPIDKQELVLMWMAHGYISSDGEWEMEDVGNDICDQLVSRSLLQYPSSDDTTTLTMHDLVHDMAQSILESKIPERMNVRGAAAADRLRIRQVNLRDKFVAFPPTYQQNKMDISFICMEFKRLRALDASHTELRYLDSAVGKLRHLRQLNLSTTEVRSLPDSICSLWNLQVLNLDSCSSLVALPNKTRKLINLRHLILDGCASLEEMPPRMRELGSLRTLSMFAVGHHRDNQLEELQNLNIGERITICRLERLENPIYAKGANLVQKTSLKNLLLQWDTTIGNYESRLAEQVLEALEPHPNLQTLSIEGFQGRLFPSWVSQSTLENLVEIDIMECHNCVRLPHLGKLPRLKSLSLQSMPVEYIVESHQVQNGIQFPSLVNLDLIDLKNLKGFFNQQEQEMMMSSEAFPDLETLFVLGCFSLSLSSLSSANKLRSLTCSSLNLASLSKLDTLAKLTVDMAIVYNTISVETLQNLSDLNELAIKSIAASDLSLPEEGLRGLKSLRKFSISGLETVTCLPETWFRHLTTLEEVAISSCAQLVELPEGIKHLKFLKSVNLTNLDKMVILPEALRHLKSSLQNLFLTSLVNLESLPDWLDELASLETLVISHCPKIESIPDSIRRMPNLRDLAILSCPQLERRCTRGEEDWHKISHIRCLTIGEFT